MVGVTDSDLQAVLMEDWDIDEAWAVQDPPPDTDALYARLAANVEAARAIDRDGLSPADQLTLDIYLERNEVALTVIPCREEGVSAPPHVRFLDAPGPTHVRARALDEDPSLSPFCYQAYIRAHTSTDLSPEEIHQIGLDELAAVEAEIAALGARLYGVSTLPQIRARADADRSQRFASVDEIMRTTQKLVDDAVEASTPVFASMPSFPLLIVDIESVQAYYGGPWKDRAYGEYAVATTPVEAQRRYQLPAVTVHEGIPGHHLERARQYERRDLPWIRRVGGDTVYVEGWGLYTEYLADDLGFYPDDKARLGALSNRALRASRLVVDTGMHALGWDRARAVAFLTEHTLEPPEYVEFQVTRYLRMPGQALAYMIGAREILRLRAEAEARLGDRFSLLDFHERFLADGSLPLGLLTSRMEAWIADQERRAAR